MSPALHILGIKFGCKPGVFLGAALMDKSDCINWDFPTNFLGG